MERKEKIYHKVLRAQGPNKRFIEAGWVENPDHGDCIYLMINGAYV